MASRIALSYLHPGDVCGAFHDSVTATLLRDADRGRRIIDGGILSMASGPLIASARNQLVERFLELENGPEWLVMVDADMAFAPDAVERLVDVAEANACPIVGGLCFSGGRGGVVEPTMYRILEHHDDGSFDMAVLQTWPDNALVEVSWTGAACLAMRRDALAAIGERFSGERHRWFAYGLHNGTTEFGEDAFFCIRAARCGYPVHVYTGVEFGHVKTWTWTAADFDRQRSREAEVGRDAMVAERRAALRPGQGVTDGRDHALNRAARRALAKGRR